MKIDQLIIAKKEMRLLDLNDLLKLEEALKEEIRLAKIWNNKK